MRDLNKPYEKPLNSAPNALRPAFSLIELLVAVSILSMAFLYVLKIHTDNRKYIIYLSERNKNSLEDSLYLTKNILRYHKSTKSAYELLQRHFKIREDQSREVLKKTQRAIFIPKEIKIIPPPETRGPTALVNEVKLKDTHPSNYWHFKIQSF